jgi:hypothetical protein
MGFHHIHIARAFLYYVLVRILINFVPVQSESHGDLHRLFSQLLSLALMLLVCTTPCKCDISPFIEVCSRLFIVSILDTFHWETRSITDTIFMVSWITSIFRIFVLIRENRSHRSRTLSYFDFDYTMGYPCVSNRFSQNHESLT